MRFLRKCPFTNRVYPPISRSWLGPGRQVSEDIWVTNLNGPSLRRLTFGDTTENFPVWSSDGSRVAYLRSLRGIYAAELTALENPN